MTQRHNTVYRWSGAAGGLVILVLSLAYFGTLTPYGLELADEGHLVHQIYRTYLGQLPYVDFHTGYTPAVYYWNAAVFSLFGINLLALRLSLAVVNALAVYCLYRVARRLGASVLAAATAGLLYVALIPFYDGHFAPFNIPYPAWYVTLFWLLSVICVMRWWDKRTTLPWFAAGVCAGVVFAFKQNSGLLNVAALLIALGLLERTVDDPDARRGSVSRFICRCERTLRWLMPLGGAAALSLMLGRSAGAREVYLFTLPLIVVVVWQLLGPAARVARSVPAFTLWRRLLSLMAGFLVITLPWLVYFWRHLGTIPFLRSVFYFGVKYEQFYFIGHPQVGPWGVPIALTMGLVVIVGLLMAKGWLPPRLVGGMIVAGAVLASISLVRHPPRMVEGFQQSVVMRVQDVAFALVLVIEWAAIGAYLLQTGPNSRAQAAQPAQISVSPAGEMAWNGEVRSAGFFLIALSSGILMQMQLYPRSDFMHLVYAAPGILILGARLLSSLADLYAGSMARTRRGRRVIGALVVAPVYAPVLIMVAPALWRIEYLVRSAVEHDTTALVRLDTPRAPLVIEPGAGRLFLGLSSAVSYLQAHSQPGELIFTFPCLDFVSFLADRRDPTRHGYYYPGSPGHAVEAEVIDALRARPPHYIVALHDHALFFVGAPLYYFNLRQYAVQGYSIERRIGMFDILHRDDLTNERKTTASVRRAAAGGSIEGPDPARNEDQGDDGLAEVVPLWRLELQHQGGRTARQVDAALAAMPVVGIPALATAAFALDPPGQRMLANLIRKSRSAPGAAALAIVIEEGDLTPTVRELFFRIIAETGDLRSVVPLLHALKTADFADLGGLSGDLFNIASRSWVENYWYAPPEHLEWNAIEQELPAEQLIQWIDNPWEMVALRSFAIRMAGARNSRTFVPFLVRILGDGNEQPQLRIDAAQGLVELGFGPEIFPALGEILGQTELMPAELIVELYPQAPDIGRELVIESMQAADPGARARAFWVAGAVQDPNLSEDLRAGLADPLPEVRMAAAWALGNIRDASALPGLREVAGGGNDEVEAFAERAIQRIALEDQALDRQEK